MNTMTYKGYIGTIEASIEDNCLYGKVLDLPNETYISYEGNTVSELKEDFQSAVEDYIESCQERGIEPQKSFSGALNVRLTPETHHKVSILAKKSGMTINAFIRKAVENQIASLL